MNSNKRLPNNSFIIVIILTCLLFFPSCTKWSPLQPHQNNDGVISSVEQSSGTAFDNAGERTIRQLVYVDDYEGIYNVLYAKYGINSGPKTNSITNVILIKSTLGDTTEYIIEIIYTPNQTCSVDSEIQYKDNLGNIQTLSSGIQSRVYTGEVEGDNDLQNDLNSRTNSGATNHNEVKQVDYNFTPIVATFDARVRRGDDTYFLIHYICQKSDEDYSQQTTDAEALTTPLFVIKPGEDIATRVQDILNNY